MNTNQDNIEAFFENLAAGEQLRQIFDNLPGVLFFDKDCNSKLIYCNKEMLQFFRCQKVEQIYGKTGIDFFPEGIASPYLKDDQQVMESGNPLIDILELALREDGELAWHCTNKLPLLDKQKKVVGLMGVSRWLNKADQKLHPAATILPALREIQSNYMHVITVQELAYKCRLSVSQFHRIFKRHFRQTPLQFMLKIRIQSACKLLRSSSMLLVEIADKCGFSEQNYFARHFKQVVGKTPMQFRKEFRC
ncbi:MAG: AraC family transcriptional regulator [Lentisphaerales bacterium]|nr:AraC family transcriptional regulator [Lentisphaerales bacterium]